MKVPEELRLSGIKRGPCHRRRRGRYRQAAGRVWRALDAGSRGRLLLQMW